VTLWANGPPRTLRSIAKVILENWKDWPRTRENCRATLNQDYAHVGMQHLLLPEPIRYLTDRMAAVNVAVPPIKCIIQLRNSQDLLPLLNHTFPLDTFGISHVSIAIRSFMHHFHPAYVFPFRGFSSSHWDGDKAGRNESAVKPKTLDVDGSTVSIDYRLLATKGSNNIFNFNWAESAADWVRGGIGYKGISKMMIEETIESA